MWGVFSSEGTFCANGPSADHRPSWGALAEVLIVDGLVLALTGEFSTQQLFLRGEISI